MTLREFLAILRQRWMTVVACALVVLAATAFATLSIPPTYTAHARVYFSAEAVDPETGGQGGVYVEQWLHAVAVQQRHREQRWDAGRIAGVLQHDVRHGHVAALQRFQ